MTAHFDLQADTGWIRRAASTLDEVAGRFAPTADLAGAAEVGDAGLGPSVEAAAAARLIRLRCGQALDAAGQLSAVATGLAGKLRIAAAQLEQAEAGAAPGHR